MRSLGRRRHLTESNANQERELERRIAELETLVAVLREAIGGPLRSQATYFLRHHWPAQEIEAFDQFFLRLGLSGEPTPEQIREDFRKALPYRTDAELTEIFRARQNDGLGAKGSAVHTYLRSVRRSE